MAKSPEQIEQEVREFYKKLTETQYSVYDDPGADLFSLEVTEEDIQRAIASYSEEKQENAQKYMKIRAEYDDIVEALKDEYGINPEIPFGRTVNHMMDLSGTPEAKQKNVELLRKLSNAEEFKKYLQEQIDLVKNFDPNIVAEKNPVNAVELFLNEETSNIINAVWIGKDFVDAAKKAGIQIPQETEDLALYNANLISTALRSMHEAQKVLANKYSACVNPDIPAVKKILDNPNVYEAETFNEAFDMLNYGFNSALDRTPFSESDKFKINRLVEEKHLLKTQDLLSTLEIGAPVSFLSQDGKQQMAIYKDESLSVWDRSIAPSVLKPTDKYADVQKEAVRLFSFIESEGLKNENNTKEFQRLVKAAEDLDAEFKKEKKLSPDTGADETRLMNLMMELYNSADSFMTTAPNLDSENAITRKQLEFADTVIKFAKTETECRNAHVDALPHNVFAREVEQLLADPQNGLDFDVMNPVDSLRIRNFGLYESYNNQIMEQTDFMFTDYSKGREGNAKYDQLIASDPYELLKSQHSVHQRNSDVNLKLYQNIKSSNAVIYPKNGDPMGMRMLYVDKNGKPRISPPLGRMPNLGDTMAKMDRLRAEGKGFQNFPEALPYLRDTDKEDYEKNLREREKLARPEFYKDCAEFFPDAGNLETLVDNALYYSAARQNFATSNYGDVYLTDDQKKDPEKVVAASEQKEKAIAQELSRRMLETSVIADALEHPEYYANRDLADQRIQLQQVHAALTYDSEPERKEELEAFYDSHHMDTVGAIEQLLRKENLKSGDLKLYNSGAGEIKGEKPWDKIEKAAELLEKGEAVYFTAPGSDKLRRLQNVDYEIKLEPGDVREKFLSQGDAEKRHTEFLRIENLCNRMLKTGTTSRDSQEYKDMLLAATNALAIAKACDTDKPTPQAVLAREQLENAKKKMAAAADAYYMAKVAGPMNSRRTERFAAAMFARHIADENFHEVTTNTTGIRNEALATKLCIAEARNKIKNNAPDAREAEQLLQDKEALKKRAAEMQKSPSFKAFTSNPKDFSGNFIKDSGKLLKQFNKKTAEATRGPVMN